MTASQPPIPLTHLPPEDLLDSEAACIDYVFALKWPQGFVCSICRHRHAYTISTRRLPLYECARCRHQTSLIAGTVMEGSHTPLTKWFAAIRLLSDPEQGISALRMQHLLSVTYKTAWSMLHKIRCALAKEEKTTPLAGDVVIHDAAYGRSPFSQSFIACPRETALLVGTSLSDAGDPERLVIRTVPSEQLSHRRILPKALVDFREELMEKDATVVSCLINRHIRRSDKIAMPLVNQARSWLHRTFHGIGKKHLQLYFYEFCSRVNLARAGQPIFAGISRICVTAGVF
ncbi:MAG: transposase [Paenibacillaceae bacterium]|nr:transposase [Paenibacillaceae bacterium]